MSADKIEKVKRSKFFQPFDSVIYGVILLAVIVSFIFVFSKNASDKKIEGAEISYGNTVLGRFTFSVGWQEVGSADGVTVKIAETDDETTITVYSPKGVNELTVNKKSGLIYMADADCYGKDCTRMKIEKPSDFIICVPNGLTVTPITDGQPYIPQEIII